MRPRWILASLAGLAGAGLLAYAVVQRDEDFVPAAYLLMASAIVIGLLGGRLAALPGRSR